MVDTIAPVAVGGGITTPLLQQTYTSDPRVLLARTMLENANSANTPLLSPLATLARSLQNGIAGATNVMLGQEYQNRQAALGQTMADALQAGQNGTPGWHNPDAGQTTQADGTPLPGPAVADIAAQPAGFEALAKVLAANPDPVAQQMGVQYGIQGMATKQAMQAQLAKILLEKDRTVVPDPSSPTGYKQIATPGAPEAAGAIAGATKKAETTGTNEANAQPGAGGQASVINATAAAKAKEAQGIATGTATGTNTANAQPGVGGQSSVIDATAAAKANEAGGVAKAEAAAKNEYEPVTVPIRQPDGTIKEVTTTRANLRRYLDGQAGAGANPNGGPAGGPVAAPPPPVAGPANGGPAASGPVTAPPPVAGPAGSGPAPLNGVTGKPVLDPEQTKTSDALGDLGSQIISNEAKATTTLQHIQILRSAAATAFRPGATGEERAALARSLVDAIETAGGKAPDMLKQAATGADVIDKVGGQMTTDIVKSLGTREALGIYQAVGKYMPNLKMSEGGFNAISNSIEQGAHRDQDLGGFRRQWLAPKSEANPYGGHSSLDGMNEVFDKVYPQEAYASRVWPMPMPSNPASAIPNVIYRNSKGQSALFDGKTFQMIGGQ